MGEENGILNSYKPLECPLHYITNDTSSVYKKKGKWRVNTFDSGTEKIAIFFFFFLAVTIVKEPTPHYWKVALASSVLSHFEAYCLQLSHEI